MSYRPSPNPVLRSVEALGTFTAFLGLSAYYYGLSTLRSLRPAPKPLVRAVNEHGRLVDCHG